jgi:hypothetical protein
MADDNTERKLATIQEIEKFIDIPGADKIHIALMKNLGWECVVKREDFKVGDKVVYIETDSLVPERPEFEFLRERKFRIKTIRLKKQVSQGLIMPLSILPNGNYTVGEDVTKIIGIRNYIKDQENNDERMSVGKKKIYAPRFLMNMAWFRWIYFKLNSFKKGWPAELAAPKTDELRIQVCARILMEHFNEDWYITEKIDGCSGTFFTYPKRIWGIPIKRFSVCSRNIWLRENDGSLYWKLAKQIDLENKLKGIKGYVCLQGECVGEGIQKNKYSLTGKDLFIFNVVRSGERLQLEMAKNFVKDLSLKFIPVIQETFNPAKEIGENKTIQEVVRYMVEKSRGKSTLADRNREGIVVRLCHNPKISFKVINPDFLLEEKD